MSARRLAIRGLSVRTRRSDGVRALVEGVELELVAGEVLALVGASGSGKSLTCAAALGVLPPGTWRENGGAVTVDGVPYPPEALRGRLVATILQNPRSAFNPLRTIGQHAAETLHATGTPPMRHEAIAQDALEAAGLEDAQRVLALHPFEMSGGMLQRAMIALALMSGAPFLFADEPTTDLDLVIQREILDLLERLTRERGLGILLVTHDMGVVARLADRVAVMDAGRVVETGDVEAIFHRPVHGVTRRLVDAHLSLYGLVRAA